MNFETEAYIDEYVIDGENTGTFTGDNTTLTYTPDNTETWSVITIPTESITSITIKRNTSLYRNRLLGWFFAALTVFLMFVIYVLAFLDQNPHPNQDFLIGFVVLLTIGGIFTTYEYFKRRDHDVIDMYIRTEDDEVHIISHDMKNTDFIEACGELIESDIETQNRNTKLETELNNNND